MQIKNKEIPINLDWDGSYGTFNDELEVSVLSDEGEEFLAVFNLFLVAEEKTTTSNDYDTPDEISVKVTDSEVSNLIVLDYDITEEQRKELTTEIIEKISF